MQVVVAAAYGGFAVEGDVYGLTSVGAEVDAHRLAIGVVGDFVIDIFRALVVPLAQDGPSLQTVGRNQHDELVISLITRGRTGIAA